MGARPGAPAGVGAGGGQSIDAARRAALVTRMELWVRYYGLGGTASLDDVKGYLTGGAPLSPPQHNTLVQAINEIHIDQGDDHPIAYLEDGRSE
jgi:hypothetical protein